MAGKGPTPADPAKRKGNDRTFAMTELGAPPAKTPALPKLAVFDENGKKRFIEHRQETKRWYKKWCESPMASMFTDVEWERLHMLAPVVDGVWRAFADGAPDKAAKMMAELRLQEQKLGATPEDRMRLRWKIGEPDTDETPTRETSRSRHADPRAGLKLVEGGKGA